MEYEVITSAQNPVVKLLASLQTRERRRAEGLFLLDGEKLVGEALRSGTEVRYLVFDQAHEALAQSFPETVRRLCMPGRLIEKLSPSRTPQGVLAAAAYRERRLTEWTPGGQLVLLDRVQDPGNLGTVIRTAEALGFAGVVVSPDSADPYGPKAVRGSMGSVLRLPVFLGDTAGAVSQLQNENYRVFAAVLNPDSLPVPECGFDQKSAVLIGNEGNGLPAGLAKRCDGSVMIPMDGAAESLNASAAAAILMWEMRRQRGS